jgi:DNA-binding XRE family transcriptional regulator
MTRKKVLKVPPHCKGMTFEEFQKEAFKDPEFVEEYEALRPEFEVLEQFIRARKKARLTQKELARRLKAQQPSVARLERGGYANTSISQLGKIANEMGYSLRISLTAKKKR